MKVLAKSSVGIILALLCGVSSSFAQGYKEAGLHISHGFGARKSGFGLSS